MRTMYVPRSEIHVHNDYIIRHHHTLLKKAKIVLYYITMFKTSIDSLT
jgi:quinol-cytochrome oxidoreductase complex cytochrome b subunit